MRIEQLREKGTSLILVSHDSAAVKRFCSRAYVFEQGNCVFDGQISEALAFNDEIMERRYLRSLLENHDPERELGRNHIDPSNDFAEKSVNELNKPRAVGKVIALQDNLESQFIDCSKAFKLEFELAIENAQFIEDDFTVGFAIHTANGVRVFGSNNRQLGVVILKSELGGQTIEAKKYVFEFPRGLPELASGMYRVILGVHDQSLVRTLYCEEAGRIIFRNRNKQNLDNDILDVEGRCAFSASASS